MTPPALQLSRPAAEDALRPDGIIVLLCGRDLAVTSTDALPTAVECAAAALPPPVPAVRAAELDGIPFYAAADLPRESHPATFHWTPLRAWLHHASASLRQAATRAIEVATWLKEHRFCGRCGRPMAIHPADGALRCPDCGFESFPILSPAIIVRVTRNGGRELLLAHNRTFTRPTFSNVAGFVESGETFEEAVRREVFEEVGIGVRDIRYFGSQNWPFPHTLLAGFTAEYDHGDLRPDGEEIDDARWFPVDGPLPLLPEPGSISRALIDDLLQQ